MDYYFVKFTNVINKAMGPLFSPNPAIEQIIANNFYYSSSAESQPPFRLQNPELPQFAAQVGSKTTRPDRVQPVAPNAANQESDNFKDLTTPWQSCTTHLPYSRDEFYI